MSADQTSEPPPTLDYATPPRDSRPRPTVALWASAALVWAASVPIAFAYGAVAANAIRHDAPAAALASSIAIAAAGVAWAEWRAVRGSAGAARLIFALSVPAALVGALLCVAGWFIALAGGGGVLPALLAIVAAEAIVVTVMVSHGLWADELR